MSTPFFPGVSALTLAGHSASLYEMTWSAPNDFAISSLRGVEAVAMTVAPKALATGAEEHAS